MTPNLSSPLLTTERLDLWLPSPASAGAMVDYFETNRRHLTPWEPPFPAGLFTRAFWERRLEQNQREYVALQSMRLVLRARNEPGGRVLGLANFTQFVRGAFMACTLGYSLDEDAQGQGYMTEALSAAIDHCFGTLRVHRIQANYLPINERSGRLLRRLEFQVEGYARDYLYICDGWRDHILTARTNPNPSDPDYLSPNAKPAERR